MSDFRKYSTRLPETLPQPEEIFSRSSSTGSVVIYQPYMGAHQKTRVHEQAIAFDIAFNSAADTREYELFQTLYAHHSNIGVKSDVFWGLLSSKYDLKAASSFPSFLEDARQAREGGADCYLYNPMIGCASIYGNVQEHAQLGGHPGMENIFSHLEALGCPVAEPQGFETFFFCNYFCGNEKFWSGYFSFCEKILASFALEAKKGSPAGQSYQGSGHYARDGGALMRPFVIERLAGYYIRHASAHGLNVAVHRPTRDDFEWKFGPRMGELLHQLFELKQSAIDKKDAAIANAWSQARLPLVQAPQPVWQMDDPPDWMPRSTRKASQAGANSQPEHASQSAAAPRNTETSPEPHATPAAQNIAPPHGHAFAGGWAAHRNTHCIWIVTPKDYVHCHAFDEVALAMSGAFEELGGMAPVVTSMSQFQGRTPIIYGGNLLPAEAISLLPKDSIIINLEQVSQDSTWFEATYLDILKSFHVFDYSPRNRDNLEELGISHARILGIGYHRKLNRIKLSNHQDIDVLFYGSMNEHRKNILEAMHESGLKVAHLFGVYGPVRDKMIARSKVVLNLHQFKSQVFAIVRTSYLLANGVCVLTEGEPSDPDLQPFLNGLAIAPYERLVERCRELVANSSERKAIAKAGFEIMRQRSQAEMLRAAMQED